MQTHHNVGNQKELYLFMQPSKLKFCRANILTISTAIVLLAKLTYVQAEAPPDESYAPPTQATEKAYNPPQQEISTLQSSHHFNLGWLGLVGIGGLAGLIRRR